MRHLSILLACIGCSLPALAAEQIPWPEHPRPDFRRSAWQNLNGRWEFAFDPKDEGLKGRWFEAGKGSFDRSIVVPFPWESRLSGIGDTQYKGIAWYARDIEIPSGEQWDGKDPWLIVGACDFEAKVWVNGEEAGAHVGGYLPFEINLARFAKVGGRVHLVIRVVDNTDPQQPTGKQVGWYTRTSGIWQTVYLEPRASVYVRSIEVTPSVKNRSAKFRVTLPKAGARYRISVGSPEKSFRTVTGHAHHLKGPETDGFVELEAKGAHLQPWTPDSPTLHAATIEILDSGRVVDRVETYFGLREVAVGKAPGRDYQYISLNGQPIYLRGALHQSFHPDGIHQYPSDAAVRGDYELCKRIGINMLRIHIKLPTPRELYWADKLGVLIMEDMPCFWKYTPQAEDWYEQMLRGAIARDFNHPSIFAWVDFNETWGIGDGGYTAEHQKWVEQMYRLTRQLDPTRLVEENSPCRYDHTVTSINSWHFYINDYEKAVKHIAEVVEKTYPGSSFNFAEGYKQGNQPLINSEYGGIGAGSGDQDISWCFKFLTNELRKHDKICGYIYTELCDIEWEHNGFVNYDRSAKEFGYDYWFPGMTLKDLNSPDFVVIDAPPLIELKEGESRDIPILISHWSSRKGEQLKLRWGLRSPSWGGTRNLPGKEIPAEWRPFAVVSQKPICLAIPAPRPEVLNVPLTGLCAFQVELVDGEDVIARNYVNVRILGPDLPRMVSSGDAMRGNLYMQFNPDDYAVSHWDRQTPPLGSEAAAGKVSATGAGYFEYHLRLPQSVSLTDVRSVQFGAELSSRAGDAKLDWPARRNTNDYPQTDVKKWPTRLRGSINGCPIEWSADGPLVSEGVKLIDVKTLELPDDPADARGVLTHARGLAPGSYGYRVVGSADLSHADTSAPNQLVLRIEVPEGLKSGGGLSIFGKGLGRYTMDPSCDLTLHRAPIKSVWAKDSIPVDRFLDRIQVGIATAEAGGHEWRYTVDTPPSDWGQVNFDARKWKKGRGGFGSRDASNAIVGTRWDKPDIWIRTQIEIADPNRIAGGTWRIYHDDDAEVFINGQKVIEKSGHVDMYEEVPLSPEAIKALRSGINVISAHCRRKVGVQNLDVGLTLLRKGTK